MRLALLAAVAKLLRIRFKVDGVPYGSKRPHQLRSSLFSHVPQ